MIESLSVWPLIKWVLDSLRKSGVDHFQTRRTMTRDHDIAIFRKLDEIASEPRLGNIVNNLIPNSRIRMDDHYTLGDFIDALNLIENTFLDKKLKLLATQLANDLGQLLNSVMRTFFKTENGFLRFYPNPIPRDRYEAEWKDVTQKIDKAWSAYKDFRLAVKENLMV